MNHWRAGKYGSSEELKTLLFINILFSSLSDSVLGGEDAYLTLE